MSTANNVGVFSGYFKELEAAKEQDQDAFLEKIEHFSGVLYENLENIKQPEVAEALKCLFD